MTKVLIDERVWGELTVSEGQSPWSKSRDIAVGPSESSHLYLKVGGRDSQLGIAWAFSSLKARPQGHPFTSKASLSPSHIVPPTGEQEFKHMPFWDHPRQPLHLLASWAFRSSSLILGPFYFPHMRGNISLCPSVLSFSLSTLYNIMFYSSPGF